MKDAGVSEVLAVTLLVSITITLGVIVAVFVFGFPFHRDTLVVENFSAVVVNCTGAYICLR